MVFEFYWNKKKGALRTFGDDNVETQATVFTTCSSVVMYSTFCRTRNGGNNTIAYCKICK